MAIIDAFANIEENINVVYYIFKYKIQKMIGLKTLLKAKVRIVEEMYKETTAVVRAERETSEQFGVGLRQGSALRPLLFIMVMNLISNMDRRTRGGPACSWWRKDH